MTTALDTLFYGSCCNCNCHETSEWDATITGRQVMFGKSQTEAALGTPAGINC